MTTSISQCGLREAYAANSNYRNWAKLKFLLRAGDEGSIFIYNTRAGRFPRVGPDTPSGPVGTDRGNTTGVDDIPISMTRGLFSALSTSICKWPHARS